MSEPLRCGPGYAGTAPWGSDEEEEEECPSCSEADEAEELRLAPRSLSEHTVLTEVQLPRDAPPEEAIRLTIPLSEDTEDGRLAAAAEGNRNMSEDTSDHCIIQHFRLLNEKKKVRHY